ncbi:uncharacterized protein LOC108627670 [Ceratina calcarata]|uniref:Uncharacterized protein LOC108627670 n=1 Tax=Ceratina calcarata TaxID=156304 RepID=A0AAJ7NA65_9HYME|nr:uncharacterized protein LOC108627670 [Ceratina calcarata]
MRDTSDMMEDGLCEDSMECEGDGRGGGLELVDTATEDSSPTIRDAAERLLTLLGVEDDEDFGSSSEDEDEGVELDELEDDFEEEQENARLLHQLAASLAKELKQSCQKPRRPLSKEWDRNQVKTNCLEVHSRLQDQSSFKEIHYRDNKSSTREPETQESIQIYQCRDTDRLRMDQNLEERVPPSSSWNAGWDACATEALRYLVEDEGLPPHHPTILAMKDHLDLQRERSFVRYTA